MKNWRKLRFKIFALTVELYLKNKNLNYQKSSLHCFCTEKLKKSGKQAKS